MRLSVEETLLIDTIEEVKFGRLCNVFVPESKPIIKRDIHGGNVKLIRALRENGITELIAIMVHEGEAQQIEVAGEKNGFRFVKKIRL